MALVMVHCVQFSNFSVRGIKLHFLFARIENMLLHLQYFCISPATAVPLIVVATDGMDGAIAKRKEVALVHLCNKHVCEFETNTYVISRILYPAMYSTSLI